MDMRQPALLLLPDAHEQLALCPGRAVRPELRSSVQLAPPLSCCPIERRSSGGFYATPKTSTACGHWAMRTKATIERVDIRPRAVTVNITVSFASERFSIRRRRVSRAQIGANSGHVLAEQRRTRAGSGRPQPLQRCQWTPSPHPGADCSRSLAVFLERGRDLSQDDRRDGKGSCRREVLPAPTSSSRSACEAASTS